MEQVEGWRVRRWLCCGRPLLRPLLRLLLPLLLLPLLLQVGD